MIPIPGEYYQLVYIIIIMLIGMPVCIRYANYPIERFDYAQKEPIYKSLLLTIFIILFVGLRPNSPVFADGPGYWEGILDHRWEYLSLEDAHYQFATKWLMSFLSSNSVDPQMGFVVFAFVMYGGAFVAMRKLFPNDTFVAMVIYFGAMGAFAGAVNGIKNGMACSMFMCALAYKDNWKICLAFLVISFGFHHSMQLSIAAFIVCLFYKNTKVYLSVWFIAFVLASLHVSYFQTLFADYTDEQGAGYLIAEKYVGKGYRFDFILYSFAPIALGIWIANNKMHFLEKYKFVFNIYLLMNSIWMLCMYASYTNRIAGLSWSLFPLLILVPLLNDRVAHNQFRVLSWFVFGQLCFTLLMSIKDLKI